MKPKHAAIAIALLSLVGLADTVVLAWDHQAFLLDPSGAVGVCEPGAGCEISRTSPWSRIPMPGPDLPISLLGFGCYLALILLAAWRARRPADPHPPRLVFGIALGAVGYSVALALYSLRVQNALCPYCTGLYVVNLLVLAVAWVDLPEKPTAWARNVWGSLRSRPAAAALIVFLVASLGGWAIYSSPLRGRTAATAKAMAHSARTIADEAAVKLDAEGRPTLGRADAPVHIVEFADFQCPHCAALWETLHELHTRRPDDVRITMMHFPLDAACHPKITRLAHPRACAFALEAECAHRQGRFAEVAAWIFDHRASDHAATRAFVERAGLDVEAWKACVASEDAPARVVADIVAGMEAGVRATPTFFINGRKVEGARPVEVLETMVDALLGRADAPAPAP